MAEIPADLVPMGYVLARIKVDPETGCWVWQAGLSNGYGSITARGLTRRAHRVAYVLTKGQIPEGAQLDHVCHTRDLACPGGDACPHRRCVNPDHLEPVTARENTARGRGVSSASAATFPEGRCARGHDITAPGALRASHKGWCCGICARERSRAWYAANQDRVRQYSRDHAEARLEATRRYRETHREQRYAAERARRLRKKAEAS